ncbi:MAG: hypothetical protein WBD22_02325, partial [Pyrinomonadaceae bacterium]
AADGVLDETIGADADEPSEDQSEGSDEVTVEPDGDAESTAAVSIETGAEGETVDSEPAAGDEVIIEQAVEADPQTEAEVEVGAGSLEPGSDAEPGDER